MKKLGKKLTEKLIKGILLDGVYDALQKALILQSDDQVNRLLAETYEQLEEPELALQHYSQANKNNAMLVPADKS